jgi:hypothetical protein
MTLLRSRDNRQLNTGLMVDISQHLKRRSGVENRRVEVASVGKGDREADLAALRKLPSGRPQVEYQFNQLAGGYWLKFVLEVIAPWEAKIVEWSHTQ